MYASSFISCLSELGTVLQNEPMSRHTTFHTGGPADILVIPDEMRSVQAIVRAIHSEKVPCTIIGGGSNLLVADDGVRGVVLMINGCSVDGGLSLLEDGSIRCHAHVLKEDFLRFAADAGCAGVEFMTGIPGCVGGGIAMNAGTNMGSFGDFLREVDYIQPDGVTGRLGSDSLRSGYRQFFLPVGSVITSAEFIFPHRDLPENIHARINSILEERRAKHPLEYPSAGSVFKNPEGHSSWKLVCDAGLKGMSVGGACVSEKHTNFIVNTGGASSSDVRNLIELVREKVRDRFGVTLETEIRFIGRF